MTTDVYHDPCLGAWTNRSNDVSTMNWSFCDLYLWSTMMTMTCFCPYLCHDVNCCFCALSSDLYPYRDRNDVYRETKMMIFSRCRHRWWSMSVCLCRACAPDYGRGLDLCLCLTTYVNCCYASPCRDVCLCCCHCATMNVCSYCRIFRNNFSID